MRLSTNQIYSSGINGILDAQTKMVKLEEQLVTGKRVLTASDDPSASQQAILLTETINQTEQFIQNTQALDAAQRNEDVILENIWNSMERAYVLALTSGNTTNTDVERSALAAEMEHIQAEILDFMNAKNSAGDYMFSGALGNQQAYIYNNVTDSFEYQGDETQRYVQLSESVSLPANDPGKFVFDNAELRHALKTTNPGAATQVEIITIDQNGFDNFYDTNYSLDPVIEVDLTVAGQYQITDSAGTVLQGPAAYTDGDTISFNGMNINIDGGVGSTVELTMTPPKDNILNSLDSFIEASRDGTLTTNQFAEEVEDIIVALANAQSAVDETRGKVGGRLNVADSLELSHIDVNIVNVETRSNLVDADVAKTISDLEKEEFALQAAQQGYVKVTQLTLFDFI